MTPQPPQHFSPEAARLFESVISAFVIEPPDETVLVMCCEHLMQYRKAEEQVRLEGQVVVDRFGTSRQHPAAGLMLKHSEAVSRLLRVLALDGVPDPLARR